MKYIWEEKDIQVGVLYWREHDYKAAKDLGYTRTVVHKIGYCTECRYRNRKNDTDSFDYCSISILTDGCVYGHGSKKDIVKQLNEGGYAPLDIRTYVDIQRRSSLENMK